MALYTIDDLDEPTKPLTRKDGMRIFEAIARLILALNINRDQAGHTDVTRSRLVEGLNADLYE